LLAESRENTMRELAEELLQCDDIDQQSSVEIADSFLDATDDLDFFLDLIDFRNSLARSNNTSNSKPTAIFSWESVLRMLILHHVTISNWQCEELHDFKRWMNMEGDSVFSANTSLIKMFVPRKFEFYCAKGELLDTFIRRDPSRAESLKKAIDNATVEAETQIEKITSAVRMIKDEADKNYPPEEGGVKMPLKDNQMFTFVVQSEARIQSHFLEPMNKNDVIELAKKTCSFLKIINKFKFDVDVNDLLNDKSGETQKNVIANLISDNALSILEDSWERIVNSYDFQLLSFFAVIMTVATSREYKNSAPKKRKDVGEFMASIKEHDHGLIPTIIQLLNQPKSWDTFKTTILMKQERNL
jgi:hypothetical protein